MSLLVHFLPYASQGPGTLIALRMTAGTNDKYFWFVAGVVTDGANLSEFLLAHGLTWPYVGGKGGCAFCAVTLAELL